VTRSQRRRMTYLAMNGGQGGHAMTPSAAAAARTRTSASSGVVPVAER
jgi:hypothetical protein